MIEVKNISYSYGSQEVLHDINFTVNPGEYVGILGNNGVGKSTLITCINKIRKPTSGNVLINGQSINKMNRTEVARLISYVAQKNEATQTTVFDSVLLGRKPYIKISITPQDIEICQEVINQVGLAPHNLRYVNQLSGGEQQKVMLARALVQQPTLLLLDEPTSNLDPKNQYEMLALVRQFAAANNISVLVILHDISLALRYCNRFLFLKDGQIYNYGDQTIVTRQTIKDVYEINGEIAEINGHKIFIPD